MNRVTEALREHSVQWLDRYLPRRTKRLMFLASFFARVKDGQVEGEPEIGDPVLEKLNSLMQLSNSDSALKLPVHLSKAIWRGKTLTDICGESILADQATPDTIEHAIKQIIVAMPKWLRYGRPEDIEKDVRQLLVHRQILTA
jgi:hypothetical protein